MQTVGHGSLQAIKLDAVPIDVKSKKRQLSAIMCQTTANRAIEVEGFAELYPAGFFIDWHEHGAGQIAHAMSGVMRIHAGENMWILPPGRALWIPPKVRHGIECHGEVAMRTVYVDGPLPFPPRPLEVWQISGLMREVILRFSSGAGIAHRRLLTELLLVEMQTCTSLPLNLPLPAEPRLRALCGSLLKDLSSHHDLEEAVKRLGLSKRTFIRKFQKETGMTFRHWQLQAVKA
jgi:hypothetical protein